MENLISDDEPYSRYGHSLRTGLKFPKNKSPPDMSGAVRRRCKSCSFVPPLQTAISKYTTDQIPQKFTKVDSDKDGYISFDEILDEIDDFFDFKTDLTSDDIYELNDFFFAQ
jgi:hypothetical protein